MRILQIHNINGLKQIMHEIKVDPYGIEIMWPKAIGYCAKVNSVSSMEANILKQEMLSLGGDVAIARDVLTGKVKKTDCIIIGTFSHYNRLSEKLRTQPFGLSELGRKLFCAVTNYQKDNFVLKLDRFTLRIKPGVTRVMGIVNLTPDSFSGDGLYRDTGYGIRDTGGITQIIDFAQKMADDGADIIDVGGESSRPGAKEVSVQEELERTIPVIKIAAKKIKVPISIDTRKPQVALAALDNGASLVNDITGLRDTRMIKLVSQKKCGVILMHSKGPFRYMHRRPHYVSVIDEIIEDLDAALLRALEHGIRKESIIIDPGIGFSKNFEHNLTILKNLAELKILGKPIMVGLSRKSFIGAVSNTAPQERLSGTIAACVSAIKNGANFVRVHDVKEVKQAIKLIDAVTNA